MVSDFKFWSLMHSSLWFLHVDILMLNHHFCQSAFLIGIQWVRFRSCVRSCFLYVALPISRPFSKPVLWQFPLKMSCPSFLPSSGFHSALWSKLGSQEGKTGKLTSVMGRFPVWTIRPCAYCSGFRGFPLIVFIFSPQILTLLNGRRILT